MSDISARAWGRQQAEAAPLWTDEQWQRVCALLGMDTSIRTATHDQHHDDDQDYAGVPERRAA